MPKAQSWFRAALVLTAGACLSMPAILWCAGYFAAAANWQRDLPPTPRQSAQRWARTIIHMHSVYSHDACDWHPIENGRVNEQCLANLRNALCRNHVDVLFLTEHREYLAGTEFNAVLNPRADDTLIWKDGSVIGSIQHCPDGHQVHLFPGEEDYTMSLALMRHPDERIYDGRKPSRLAALRAAGGLIGVPHVEHPLKSVMQIRAMRPDLMEIYNLHANLTATTRRRSTWLVGRRFLRLLQFLPKWYLDPDLLFLTFFSEDEVALAKWGQIVRTTPVTGIVGTDAHENTFSWEMGDGERMDGYRRAMRWFSNFVLVDELSRDAIVSALKSGKVFMVFEVFGTPSEFAFSAVLGGSEHGMGDELEVNKDAPVTLSVKRPRIRNLDPTGPQPDMVLRILRATSGGWEEVQKTTGSTLDYRAEQPGAYRAEVRIKPNHLAPFLPGAKKLIGYRPWIYSNPIYLR